MLDHVLFEQISRLVAEPVKRDFSLARFTAARLGGPADILAVVRSVEELAATVTLLWEAGRPFMILGGGSNILVSEAGYRGVVLLNQARQVQFSPEMIPAQVKAASGANLGLVARQAAIKGLSGLEWAAGIPGTVGGAIFGNAGAHDGDMAGNLLLAEILHKDKGMETWSGKELNFAYRSSRLKQNPGEAVVLSATLKLESRATGVIQAKMDEFLARRRRTQPPGASMGSMFKNPPGDYAGRLIDAAGLKGTRIGDAEISPLHGNFFINRGDASAHDVFALIQYAREQVLAQFGVELELEVELVGDWDSPLPEADPQGKLGHMDHDDD